MHTSRLVVGSATGYESRDRSSRARHPGVGRRAVMGSAPAVDRLEELPDRRGEIDA
jgi:hypothetical protein